MKKRLISFFKLIFWAIFIYHLGIIQYMNNIPPDNSPLREHIVWNTNIDHRELGILMHKVYHQKIQEANDKVAQGGTYSPYDYFTDMKEVNDFRKKMGIIERPTWAELQQLSTQSIDAGLFTYKDVEKAREIAYPGYQELEKKNAYKGIIVTDILQWLWSLYISMLPWALLLLLLWVYEQNDMKSWRIKNPLNFICTVLIHPIVIFIVVRKWWVLVGREATAKLEIRRTKEFAFSYFSQDELALIKEFATSRITIREFRIVHQRTVRHSWRVAIMATLVVQIAYSQKTTTLPSRVEIVQLSYSHNKDGTHISLFQRYENQEHYSVFDSVLTSQMVLVDYESILIVQGKRLFRVILCILSKGHTRLIEPIPLCVATFFNELVTYKTIHNHEKNNQNNFNGILIPYHS